MVVVGLVFPSPLKTPPMPPGDVSISTCLSISPTTIFGSAAAPPLPPEGCRGPWDAATVSRSWVHGAPLWRHDSRTVGCSGAPAAHLPCLPERAPGAGPLSPPSRPCGDAKGCLVRRPPTEVLMTSNSDATAADATLGDASRSPGPATPRCVPPAGVGRGGRGVYVCGRTGRPLPPNPPHVNNRFQICGHKMIITEVWCFGSPLTRLE